nr:hypothetical protein [Paraburkholderia sp. BL8N3]
MTGRASDGVSGPARVLDSGRYEVRRLSVDLLGAQMREEAGRVIQRAMLLRPALGKGSCPMGDRQIIGAVLPHPLARRPWNVKKCEVTVFSIAWLMSFCHFTLNPA